MGEPRTASAVPGDLASAREALQRAMLDYGRARTDANLEAMLAGIEGYIAAIPSDLSHRHMLEIAESAFRAGFQAAAPSYDIEWEQGEWLDYRAELLASGGPPGGPET